MEIREGDLVLLRRWEGTENGLCFAADYDRELIAGRVGRVITVYSDGDVQVDVGDDVPFTCWAKGYFEKVSSLKVGDTVKLRKFENTELVHWHPMMDALIGQTVAVKRMSRFAPGAIVVNDSNMREWTWPVGTFDVVAESTSTTMPNTAKVPSATPTFPTTITPPVEGNSCILGPKEEENEMPNTSVPATNRNRVAVDEALRRAPIEWSLDEAHEMIVKLAVGTVKVRAHKPIIKAWVEEQLQSEYGKALLGVVIGNVVPLVAPHLGRGEKLVQRVSDELLAVSYKKAMVRAARDLKKVGGPLLKAGMKLFATLFDRVEDAERMREVAALGAGSEGVGLFAEAAVSDKIPTKAQH
jgi:hypothetical protein